MSSDKVGTFGRHGEAETRGRGEEPRCRDDTWGTQNSREKGKADSSLRRLRSEWQTKAKRAGLIFFAGSKRARSFIFAGSK